MSDEIRDLKEFNTKYGLLTNKTPVHLTKRRLEERVNFMYEELLELKSAAAAQNLAGIADALIDIVYVAKGTAVMLGLPWDELWSEVHATNMRKVRGISSRQRADVLKPEGWMPPDLHKVLCDHGYVVQRWFDEHGVFQEGLAKDDDE